MMNLSPPKNDKDQFFSFLFFPLPWLYIVYLWQNVIVQKTLNCSLVVTKCHSATVFWGLHYDKMSPDQGGTLWQNVIAFFVFQSKQKEYWFAVLVFFPDDSHEIKPDSVNSVIQRRAHLGTIPYFFIAEAENSKSFRPALSIAMQR